MSIPDSLLASVPLQQSFDRFSIVIDHVGLLPRLALPEAATASVLAWADKDTGKAIALIIDHDAIGPSVTNCAGEALAFIQREHFGRRDIRFGNVRWVYLDTAGKWDEILSLHYDGGNSAVVGFKPLEKRDMDSFLALLEASGFPVDSETRRWITLAAERQKSRETIGV